MAATDDLVVLGSLDCCVYAYTQTDRSLSWTLRVHDAVLCLQVYREDYDEVTYRMFAALADGTLAVCENVSDSTKTYDLFYLAIGPSQVTCLQLLGSQLWCACGNTIFLIDAGTLDPIDRFTISTNPYDNILSLTPGLPGMWLSVRGSSVLELWDAESLSAKLLYDTRTGHYPPNMRKEDESYFNNSRITSILALDHSVWVGTGEGTLITFDVFTNNRTPLEDGDSWVGLQQKRGSEEFTTLCEVNRRVKDVCSQRSSREERDLEDSDTSGSGTAGEGGPLTVEGVKRSCRRSTSAKVKEPCKTCVDCGVTSVNDGLRKISDSKRNSISSNNLDIHASPKSRSMARSPKGGFISEKGFGGSSKQSFAERIMSTDSNKTLLSQKTMESFETDVSGMTVDSSLLSHNDSGYNKTGSVYSTSSCPTDSLLNSSRKSSLESASALEKKNVARSVGCVNGSSEKDGGFPNDTLGDIQKVRLGYLSSRSNSRDESVANCEQNPELSNKNDVSMDKLNNSNNSSHKLHLPQQGISTSEEIENKKNTMHKLEDSYNEADLQNIKDLVSGVVKDSAKKYFLDGACENVNNTESKHITLKDNDSLTSMTSLNKNQGQGLSRFKSLESSGRSFSEDSSRTVGSDDVFASLSEDSFSHPLNQPSFLRKYSNGFLEGTDSDLTPVIENEDCSQGASKDENGAIEHVNINNSCAEEVDMNGNSNTACDNFNERAHKTASMDSSLDDTLTNSQDNPSEEIAHVERPTSLMFSPKRHPRLCRVSTHPTKHTTVSGYVAKGISNTKQTYLPTENHTEKHTENHTEHHTENHTEHHPHELASNGNLDSRGAQVSNQDEGSIKEGIGKTSYLKKQSRLVTHSQSRSNISTSSSSLSRENSLEKPSHIPVSTPNVVVGSSSSSTLTSIPVESSSSSQLSRENSLENKGSNLSRESSLEKKSSNLSRESSLEKPSKQTSLAFPTTTATAAASSSSSRKNSASSNLSRQHSDVSSVMNHIKRRSQDATWRLDYTNVIVDTDGESVAASNADREEGQGQEGSLSHLRRNSSDAKNQRLNQFLKDAAASFVSTFGHDLDEDSMSAALGTPTASVNSWSSYDEISTPSCKSGRRISQLAFPRSRSGHSLGSHTTSIASTMDLFYSTDLTLMSKNKISGKPVRWMLKTENEDKPCVLSFSGGHYDDEAVLIWVREENETLWTNRPVLEYNPKTRTSVLPMYMRMARANSIASNKS